MDQPPLILIVDGERGSSALLKMRLEAAGYATQTLANGKEVIVALLDSKPDVIVLNANLRDMKIADICRYLKDSPECHNIQVVLITEHEKDAQKIAYPHLNVVAKPYDPDAFLTLVAKAVEKRKRFPVDNTAVVQNEKAFPQAQPAESLKKKEADTATTPAQLPPQQVNLKELTIASAVIERVPARFIWHYKFVPTGFENNILTVATSRPQDTALRDDLYQYLGFKINTVSAKEFDIDEAIKKYYGVGGETIEQISSDTMFEPFKDNQESEGDIAKLAEDASVIKLVNQILLEANEKNASDIHIEPYQGKLKLRYRVDGVLLDAKVHENIVYFLPAIISRIKIMSGLNIVERRLPQDGRAKVNIKNEKFDLRVSTVPSVYGESVVIRILPSSMLFSLEKLGLLDRDFQNFRDLIKRPHGMIFVTGPTGSGKSTTLYAILTQIKSENTGAKIITIEDPVEYQLEGVIQVQVNPEIGFTFAKALRSFLRHDPDIMMVGEVRDHETAEMAIRMALTGHLLFSTLHTNDAASGVTRLLDIGVEPYLLSSSVIAFLAQRLLRTICPTCKVEVEKSQKILQEIGSLRGEISEARAHRESDLKKKDFSRDDQSPLSQWLRKGEKCYQGKGCEACSFSGYKGRTSIFELLVVNEPIQELIIQKASVEQIKKEAIKNGMRTLYQDGFDKVVQGVTTFEEVLRVVREDEVES